MRLRFAVLLAGSSPLVWGLVSTRIPHHSCSSLAVSAASAIPEDDAGYSTTRATSTRVDDDDDDDWVPPLPRDGSLRVTIALSEPQGMTLGQLDANGRLRLLDLDTLRITTTSPQRDLPEGVVVVTQVDPSSKAYREGVRVGDVLQAVSATMGGALWPKSTLEGVQSAMSSRKVASKDMTLSFKREQQNLFELTLQRPLGFDIQERDGYVEVTAINENASTLAQYAIKVGDRVVAVDSSLGDRMWPVSTVAGVQSACTSRLPGQPVTLRFERPETNMEDTSGAAPVALQSAPSKVAAKPVAPVVSPNEKELIKRCRQVLRRYAVEDNELSKFKGKYAVPAKVADKVVDALASASVQIDSVTLSMIMSAYLSVNQPEDAIRVFEASTGFSGDGSATPFVKVMLCKDNGCVVPNDAALNLYSATALLQAHSQLGDLAAVQRVMAAIEGRSGVEIGGAESAPWPFTGPYGSIRPDTQCYNIAMAAAERIGGEEGLRCTREWFTRLVSPSKKGVDGPVRDQVTYNTMVSAYANAGYATEAFRIYEDMKRVGVRPDKFTFTSLIKVVDSDDDIQELLYAMREQNVAADVVTYNTIIKSFCEDKKWTQATRLVNEMESRGILPDSRTYGFLMNAMLKADKTTACLALFESACANPKTAPLTYNVHLYTTAITAASVLGDYERALELIVRMKANGVKPNLKTITATMGACLVAGQADLAAQVYRSIDSPDGYAMSQGIRALCANGEVENALSILKEQPRRGIMSGKQVMRAYRDILSKAVETNALEVARDAIQDLLRKGLIPSKEIFDSIVKNMKLMDDDFDRSIGQSQFDFLVFLMDSLQRRKLALDGSCYVALLTLGKRLGSKSRRFVAALPAARTSSTTKDLLTNASETQPPSWKDWDPSSSDERPALLVRVAPRDFRSVLRAERQVQRFDAAAATTTKS